MANPIREAQGLGQAIWLDYVQRGLITSGTLHELIERGISGLTSNPTIFERAIAGSTDYDEALLAHARAGKSVEETFEALAIEDIQNVANLLRPIYDSSGGLDGFASMEVSPLLAHDRDGTIEEAKRLFVALDRPNVLIKVPATPEGIPAIRRLIDEGINVNVTLIFSLDVYRQVMEAYIAGLEDRVTDGADVSGVASVASFFISRIDTAVDVLLEGRIEGGQRELEPLRGKAAVASAKRAYQAFKECFHGKRFAVLSKRSAHVQRPLWASTGTKNPSYSDVKYVEPLIGRDTVNTMPPATMDAFLDHGHAAATVERDVSDAERSLTALAAAGISMDSVTEKLLADGVKSFADSFEKLLAGIEQKQAQLLARQ